MVSSTFTDLGEHRAALIKAINANDLKPVGMEDSSARPDVDVIGSSLEMVRKAAAYTAVISHKYGQIPEDAVRNPAALSLTELEFNEAIRLNRPVLLFIMGPDHYVKPADVERDPEKFAKLEAFRERAKRLSPDSGAERVYAVFNDLAGFQAKAIQAIGELRAYLERPNAPPPEQQDVPSARKRGVVPAAPAFYAEPPYIGSHRFVGRQAQLDTLTDWAAASDPHPVLLFEAIGGAGKSMLTWQWMNHNATAARSDWAGRFWYSFYEKGAVMADFCRRALAYMTGRPLKHFRGKKTGELSGLLLQELRERPWLLVLDGLERVLVAYHRFDAAQLADEHAGENDEIAKRDPCAAIRPEDDDLLRALASAGPSKLLVTSRLIPRVLLNPSSQAIPGVRHERLPGLRPADAEALLRSCGVTGDSHAIQVYLKSHCDCHPLVTGVLAGLINEYLPARGDFDAWAEAADGGAALDLAKLNLVQKRNHILHAALAALPEKSRQLLSTLALLSEAANYATMRALNPHLSNTAAAEDDRIAQQELAATVRDLEHRGLLQYDSRRGYYDLHPVVRGIAAGGLRDEEKVRYGQRVVDHFSRESSDPYQHAETLEDLSGGLHVVRAFLQMGYYDEAADAFSEQLTDALMYNLEANDTVLALLRPFFSDGWDASPRNVDFSTAKYLTAHAALALWEIGEGPTALSLFERGVESDLRDEDWEGLWISLSNILGIFMEQNRIRAAERCADINLDLAALLSDEELFGSRFDLFHVLALRGRWSEAEEIWGLLDPMGRTWRRGVYRLGNAEADYAEFRFWRGDLREEDLSRAEKLTRAGRDRSYLRKLHGLRGAWLIGQRRWAPAAASLHEAVRMAREIGQTDGPAEAQLALANLHLGKLADPRDEAEQLSKHADRSDIDLAALWLAIGDRGRAKEHAVAAYESAWADGEPYVHRYELDQARALLEALGAGIPDLPPYDPAMDESFPWEEKVRAAIEELKADYEEDVG